MKLPRSIVAAGCAALLGLPLVLAAKLHAALIQSSGELGASLAESTPRSWQARAAADTADDGAEVATPPGDPSEAAGASPPLSPLASSARLDAERGGPEVNVKSRTHTLTPRRATLPRGIRVREGRVLALSRTAAIPGASPVAASATRPAGLRLSGVGGLGVGVQDGDVLTHAGGQALRSLAQVIGLVAGARHARAAEVSGTLYRGDEPINLVVEMPYLKRRSPRRAPSSADRGTRVNQRADGSAPRQRTALATKR